MNNQSNLYKEEKEYIRVILLNEDGNPLDLKQREDEYATNIDSGFEDLLLKEDSTKLNLYMTSDKLLLWHNKTYKVISREFMPCRPVSLYLLLKEE